MVTKHIKLLHVSRKAFKSKSFNPNHYSLQPTVIYNINILLICKIQ